MPTCGTRYYRYDELEHKWVMQYANDLTQIKKKRIINALETVTKDMGIWCDESSW